MRQAFLRNRLNDGRLVTWLLAGGTVLMAIFIILYPKQAYAASLQGLRIWWDIVFPALLPFLIASEILIAFGCLHFLGVLLEPFMRLVFRLPGSSGWAICMGAAAGFAASAKTVGHMRKMGWLSKSEGESLLAISYLCSPVFIVSLVAVGFFHNERLGWLLVFVHFSAWLAASLIISIVYRKGGPSIDTQPAANPGSSPAGRSFVSAAFAAMSEARRQDGRGFGKLLGDAVTNSVQALLMIGGYIMLFSVILNILSVSGALSALVIVASSAFTAVGIPLQVVPAVLNGIFELHLGSFSVSLSDAPAAIQAAAVGAILAWGGFSSHAQVKGLVSDTDLSIRPYLWTRFLHALVAFWLTIWLWNPFVRWFGIDRPHPLPTVVGNRHGLGHSESGTPAHYDSIAAWGNSLLWFICLLVAFVLLSIAISRARRTSF